MEPDIVIFGALHRDLVGVLRDPHTAGASNAVRFSLSTGGVGANVARAAIRSQQIDNIRLVCPTGEQGLDTDLAAVGFNDIDVCPVAVPGATSGRFVAIVDARGELMNGYADTTACEAANYLDLLQECPASARTVVLDANLSEEAIAGLATALPIRRCALAVSPGKARKLIPIADRIDLLFCNRREAVALTGLNIEESASSLSEALIRLGFTTHVLTDGEAPLIVADVSGQTSIEAAAVTLTCTGNAVGAGDALAGATVAALHAGQSLRAAIRESGLPAAAAVITGALS